MLRCTGGLGLTAACDARTSVTMSEAILVKFAPGPTATKTHTCNGERFHKVVLKTVVKRVTELMLLIRLYLRQTLGLCAP